ncbi:MAG: glutathione S-transferase [Holophagales bacterium]|nr:glutathione S-transferase [Holophagales bacterium]MYD21104.1 glutathione S-transferase [Holophagales bacterium]MYI34415.1 glutathione S-transferase [Holophagales bacterium]
MSQALTLVIGNKNYSSWSLRPWALMTELGIPFSERMLKFDSEDWEANIDRLSPARLVPVLWEGEPGDGFATFDTVAIVERLNDLHPARGIWPFDARARARARSLVANFHSGYPALRSAMPMNIRSHHPGKGHEPEVMSEIERLTRLWRDTRAEFGTHSPYLFGNFSAADAYFLPVASRFATYEPPLDREAQDYCRALLDTMAMREWSRAARLETEFVPEDEPYADPP